MRRSRLGGFARRHVAQRTRFAFLISCCIAAAAGFLFLDEIVWAILKSTANGSPEIEENKRIEQREIGEVLSVKSGRQ